MNPSGGVAEWLGRGLQSPPPRFESGRRLQKQYSVIQNPRCGENHIGGFAYLTTFRELADHERFGGLRNTFSHREGLFVDDDLGAPGHHVVQPNPVHGGQAHANTTV